MNSQKLVIVTGGAGYIGSHTVVELLNADYEVVIIDNLCNSSQESLRRVEEITNKKIKATHIVDITDETAMDGVFDQYRDVYAVIHFAGLKAVGESWSLPIHYYETNIQGTLVLLKVMKKHNVGRMVFSSSATVYGDVKEVAPEGLTEDLPTSATNPYGRTKLFIEHILKDTQLSDPEFWQFVLLRYFNPVGAHESGMIGEDPKGIPNNLMPYVTQVAVGRRSHLNVFGSDYNTKDGTGVRDFIHVVDLAKGHIAAVKHLSKNPGAAVFNLGTGNGITVLEMVEAMKKVSGKDIPYKLVDRRAGDVAICFACPDKAQRILEWKAEFGVERMCADAWKWQSKNPNGYSQGMSAN